MGAHPLEVVITPHLPPAPRTGLAMAQAQHVPCNIAPGGAVRSSLAFHVVHHVLLYRITGEV
jgi:hypothetical protein